MAGAAQFPTPGGGEAGRWAPDGRGLGTHSGAAAPAPPLPLPTRAGPLSAVGSGMRPVCFAACCDPIAWWADDVETTTAEATDRATTQRAPLQLLNSFTKRKTPFAPLEGNRIGWYICGPTVYDSAHMGHARNYVNFDVLRRVMGEYFGYDIKFVMNVTDIDDKIILRAHKLRSQAVVDLAKGAPQAAALQKLLDEESKDLPALESATAELVQAIGAEGWDIQDGYLALAREFEEEFMQDMEALRVLKPDILTRVSEYVEDIIKFVERIVERGFAYESNGSVYFDTIAFNASKEHSYGKLRETALADTEEAMDGEGALGAGGSEKRNASDFVLWKRSKAGEPKWASPWGDGRPGWHIECSAMCSDHLGDKVDINGGGCDLAFPHHENQLAQSEAYHGNRQWVNFFLHTGHLHIAGLKMSKSLKNFITIRAALDMYTWRQIRFLFLICQWSEPMELTPVSGPDGQGCVGFSQMQQACSIEKTFAEFFFSVKGQLRQHPYSKDAEQTLGPAERKLQEALARCEERVHAALCDNIDTATTIRVLQDVVNNTNSYFVEVPAEQRRAFLVLRVAQYVTRILSVLGVCEQGDGVGFGEAGDGGSREETLGPYLDALVQFRDQVRTLARESGNKEMLELCDKVRDDSLPPLGVRIDDAAGGALWKLYDPKELQLEMQREREEREAKAEAARLKKEEAARKQAEKERLAAVPPANLFKQGEYEGLYSKFDDAGVPTHDKEGEELTKSARKKLDKAFKMQEKNHNAWLEKQPAKETA